jgi:2-methylcitrate dehydratase PrpD
MTDPGKNDPVAEEEARRRRQKIQRQLDEALEDSFPASDPVSIVTSHEEEDWGEAETPPVPEKPPQGAS